MKSIPLTGQKYNPQFILVKASTESEGDGSARACWVAARGRLHTGNQTQIAPITTAPSGSGGGSVWQIIATGPPLNNIYNCFI